MQLGMVGLGRMGANMVRRLLKGGHQCVVYNRSWRRRARRRPSRMQSSSSSWPVRAPSG